MRSSDERPAARSRGARRPRWASPLAALRAQLGSRNARWLFEALFLAAAASTVWPLFCARYVPIQDLPQHVAAVRVLHDYDVAEFGFRQLFERSLFSTQYLSVYLLSDLLSTLVGPLIAYKSVIAAAMIVLPYALRSVLRELGRPRSYALAALPLAYNAHWLLGFSNFIAGLPLMFWGLALALGARRRTSRALHWGSGALAVLVFYTHVVPYAVLLLAVLLLAPAGGIGKRLAWLTAFLPSMLAALVWLGVNPAGEAIAALVMGREGGPSPNFLEPGQALRELPNWLMDVLKGNEDDWIFVAWSLLVLSVFLVGKRSATSVLRDALRARVAWLVPLVWGAYFLAPTAYSFIWPIHGRFPIIALLFAIVSLPRARPLARCALAAGCVTLSLGNTWAVTRAFRGAWTEEYAGLAPVLRLIPPGSRVAGLIWSRASEFVNFSPYLHAVAWAQVERGGAVMFSFAEFPQSPFRFMDSAGRPPVWPRWEWLPERVDTERDLRWYGYTLTRGGPSSLPGWQLQLREGQWALWVPVPR